MVIPTYTDGTLGSPFARVMATNLGQRPVTISRLTIELPGRQHFSPDVAVGLDRSRLHGSKVKLTPIAEDSAGRGHRGTRGSRALQSFKQ